MNLPSLPSAILDPCDIYASQKLNCTESEAARENLLEAIDRKLPTQARDVKVTVDFESKHYVLDGKVPSYHVKQLLYRICRQTLAHFSMVDRLFVSAEHEHVRRYDFAELS